MPVLQAEKLGVAREAGGGPIPVLHEIDLDLPDGEVTVLLGETGAGKTLLARALVGLLPSGFVQSAGRIRFRGRAMAGARDWEAVRGRGIFYAPQNAAACLNPVVTVGRQIGESSRCGAGEIAGLLERLRFADPGRVLRSCPHELSGGENQRVLLILALAARAEVLILDEPTAELDEEAQADCLRVLAEERRRRRLTVLLISHHLGSVRAVAARIGIMRCGEMVFAGAPAAVLAAPVHPYVREVAACLAEA
jgi:peptide/nickel transport system ATP-binding protein